MRHDRTKPDASAKLIESGFRDSLSVSGDRRGGRARRGPVKRKTCSDPEEGEKSESETAPPSKKKKKDKKKERREKEKKDKEKVKKSRDHKK